MNSPILVNKSLEVQNSPNNEKLNENLKLAWSGDLVSLKLFVEKSLKLDGIWSSPGGEKKLFKNDNTSIIWLKNKRYLSIEGEHAKEIKRRMLSIIFTGTDDDEETFETMRSNKPTNTAHEASYVELSTDLEGIKLDMVISEARSNKRHETCTSEIGHLREEMLNSRCLVNEMQNQIKVLNNALEMAKEENGSACQDLKKEIAGIRKLVQSLENDGKTHKQPVNNASNAKPQDSQLKSPFALKNVYDKGMIEIPCSNNKREVLWESEIYSRENQNTVNHNNKFFTCEHYGNQDASEVRKAPPKQQEPKVHSRKQNARNESYQLSQKTKHLTKTELKKESLSSNIIIGSSFLESNSKFPRGKPLSVDCLRSLPL